MIEHRAAISAWLERRFAGHEYRVCAELQGTYGLVWIMATEHSNVTPQKFAVKSFDPTKQVKTLGAEVRGLFERELALWLRMPFHRNVMTALGLEFVPIDPLTPSLGSLPLVRMGFMNGSLADWVGQPTPAPEQRLAALAQCCNGLGWLYENGLQGHGDLKPANVLVRDLRELFDEAPGVPTWKIAVADLGWADIWRDLEGAEAARRAWRPYLAPERLDGTVVPTASDMFAFGVIATELLGGVHPAGPSTDVVGRWKDRDYAKWARGDLRELPLSIPVPIASLIRECLAAKPEDRPMPTEIIERICRHVGASAGYDLRSTLQLWTDEARGSAHVGHKPWAAEVAGDMGGPQRDRSIDELSAIVVIEPIPTSANAVARWLTSSCSLARLLLRRGGRADHLRAGDIAFAVLRFVVANFTRLDLRHELYRDPLSGNPAISDLEPSEVTVGFGQEALRVLHLVGRHEEAAVRALHEELSRRWTKAQPTADEFVRLLLDRDNDHNDDGDEP